jgi:putative protease
VVSAGDGICFFAKGELQGTNINRVEGGRVYPNKCEGIAAGTEIYRNYDHAFVRAVEHSRMRRRIGVAARVGTAGNRRLEVVFTDETGLSVSVVREGVFEPAKDPAKMAATIREQLSRSGDTIFEVKSVETGKTVPPFIPVSLLAQMRREGLEGLREARTRLDPCRSPATEDTTARFPRERLTAAENVTNRLAESFWRDHGVTGTEPPLELRTPLSGEVLMRTRYCIRREMGECLREGTRLKGDLYIERGATRLRLGFDCNKCEMSVTKI